MGSPIDGRYGSTNYTENYSPWGEKLDNPIQMAGDVGYTGQQSDVATELTYAQARYYDPVTGRFLSADPQLFSFNLPQLFNRYSYAYNNPFRYVDPDGRYGRGTGFTEKEWRRFEQLQRRAASRMHRAASREDRKADKKDKKGQSGSADNRATAAALRSGAAILESNGSDGYIANQVSGADYLKVPGTTVNGAAFVKGNGPVVTINRDGGLYSTTADGLPGFRIGHEALHSAGYSHQYGFNNSIAYKYGSPIQRAAFKQLIGTSKALINPDHIMDAAY